MLSSFDVKNQTRRSNLSRSGSIIDDNSKYFRHQRIKAEVNTVKGTRGIQPLFKLLAKACLPDEVIPYDMARADRLPGSTGSHNTSVTVLEEIKTMIDSGANLDFISRTLVNQLKCAVDGNGQVLEIRNPLQGASKRIPYETCVVKIVIGPYSATRVFTIIDMDTYDLILGRPWLHDTNPHLDWRTNDVRFRHMGQSVYFRANADFETAQWLQDIPGSINAAEARRLEKDEQAEIFVINVRLPLDKEPASGVRFGSSDTRLQDLYNEYKEDIFPEELVDLPISRGRYDHRIKLINDKLVSSGYTIRFSTEEIEVLHVMLEKLLSKGYISPSNSPFGAPCFFVRKQHGAGLRLVVDWRNLNNNTIKDQTQLPNIADLLAQLHKARFFSVLDGNSGFWQVLLAPEDRYKTAFRTPFGSFEWNVMGMGLTNAPATYQSLMNAMFRPHLRDFVSVYLDDVLVYSNTLAEHLEHLRTVFEILKSNKVACKPSKCTLAAQQVLYLGHIVGNGELRVDPEKVAKILGIKSLTCKADVSTFLGMCGYLASHLVQYSDVALPLTNLTHVDVPFRWTSECEESFLELKRMVSSAPVLMIPDPNRQFIVASDASIHSGSAVLIQCDDQGARHPVAFFSRKWTASEFKWPTRDKEARAMLDAIEHWDTWLKGRFFICETDHNSLQYIRTQKNILPRQERLLDNLATYHYRVDYVDGPRNGGPDGLSRLAELAPLAADTDTPKALTTQVDSSLIRMCLAGYEKVEFFKIIMARVKDLQQQKQTHIWLRDGQGLLWYHDINGSPPRLGVPTYEAQLQLMKEAHDSVIHNHQAVTATITLLQNNYFWPHMYKSIKKFVLECQLCQRARPGPVITPGLLHPLSIPSERWESVSMDFVTKLPVTPSGHSSIFTVVDRLTKRIRLMATTNEITSMETALLFFRNITTQFGLPKNIVSDRDPKFTSEFWMHLHKLLGTTLSMSTVDHPQSDGQTERMHKTINARLRTLINHAQNNWDDMLPSIEFQMNCSKNESTGFSPFELDIGRMPRSPLSALATDAYAVPSVDAVNLVEKLKSDLVQARDNILLAQEHQRKSANNARRQESYSVGDKVLIVAEALRSASAQATRPKSKLDLMFDGPFTVTEVITPNSYRIDIPSSYGVHDVINITKLKHFIEEESFPGRIPLAPAPDNSRDTGPELLVHAILARKPRKGRRKKGQADSDPSRFDYLTQYVGERQDQSTWQPYSNFIGGDEVSQALTDFLATLPSQPPEISRKF